MTGASGIQYALRLLECLIRSECQVYLMMSKPAQVVMSMETDLDVPARASDAERYFSAMYGAADGQLRAFGLQEWTAPVASGSGVPDAMVVCPCTTGTLASIASGLCNSLLERAADVVLKERRQLILAPREMPLSSIHLENMLTLARMGAIIMPPNPGFYNRPTTLEEMIDFVVARILDQLQIDHQLMPRWGLDPQ
ncbi:MAG: UbiX family flavin prenyltransferase [Gammaproteobacteria bacterium]|nr:UbiX family flavin prenyltransferase [Gammaproteobacteria bacterium]